MPLLVLLKLEKSNLVVFWSGSSGVSTSIGCGFMSSLSVFVKRVFVGSDVGFLITALTFLLFFLAIFFLFELDAELFEAVEERELDLDELVGLDEAWLCLDKTDDWLDEVEKLVDDADVTDKLLTEEERLLAALLVAFELDELELLEPRLEPPDWAFFPFFDFDFFFTDLSESIEDTEHDTDVLDDALEFADADRFCLCFLEPFFDFLSSAEVDFLLGLLSPLLAFRSVLSALGSKFSTRRLDSLPRLLKSCPASLETLLMYFSAS
jgi:hypothetical protein